MRRRASLWFAYISVALVEAVGLATTAHAQSPWYVSGSLGGYFAEALSGSTTITNGTTHVTGPGTNTTTFDPSVVANGALGYRLPAGFRAELELGYAYYQSSTVSPSSSSFPQLNGQTFNQTSGGDHNRYSGTLNLFYDLPLWYSYRPYVGGGIGAARINDTKATYRDSSGNTFTQGADDTTRGIAFLEGGLSVKISDRFDVVPAYRWVHYFGDSPPLGDEVAHIVKLGVRYSF